MKKNKTNNFAILGLVFSIFVGLPGLIFSIIGLNRIKKTGESGKGLAIAGIIISIIQMVLSVVLVVLLVVFIIIGENSYYDDGGYLTTYEKCNSYYTECEKSDWYCEEYGCWCEYDDGDDYDYLWCDSYDFD